MKEGRLLFFIIGTEEVDYHVVDTFFLLGSPCPGLGGCTRLIIVRPLFAFSGSCCCLKSSLV